MSKNDKIAVPDQIAGPIPEDIVFGTSLVMQAIRRKVGKLAQTVVPVLIQGESGTGKEILARYIHVNSPYREGPFIKVSCAAIPNELTESELFGYSKGAFTGATDSKPGRVEMAHLGSLYLDEIAELDPARQAKLLQVLQDGRFYRIGDQEETRIDTRVICATNRNLEKEIIAGTFRQDLFYRINVFQDVYKRQNFIILDVLMPELDGLDTLRELMKLDRTLNVIMLSCSNEVGTVVEAIRLGALDYLTKPFEKPELDAALLKCRQKQELRQENAALREYCEQLKMCIRDRCYFFAACVAAVVAAALAYFFWKRSTRPAVSISFCLPVKNGWQFEQISTLIRSPRWVERV